MRLDWGNKDVIIAGQINTSFIKLGIFEREEERASSVKAVNLIYFQPHPSNLGAIENSVNVDEKEKEDHLSHLLNCISSERLCTRRNNTILLVDFFVPREREESLSVEQIADNLWADFVVKDTSGWECSGNGQNYYKI